MIESKLSIKLLWYVTPLVIIPLLFLGGFTLSNVTQSTEKQADIIVSHFVQQQQQNIFNYIEVFHSATDLLSNSPVLSQFIETDSNEPSTNTARIGALLDVFASYTDAYPDILSIDLITLEEKSLAFILATFLLNQKNIHSQNILITRIFLECSSCNNQRTALPLSILLNLFLNHSFI